MKHTRSNAYLVLILSALNLVLLYAPASAFALPERFFGMTAQEHAYDQGPEYGDLNWAAMQTAGVERFRMEIKWSKIAAAGDWRGQAAWQSTYDHYFEEAAQHGIEILPYIYGREDGSTGYFKISDPGFSAWSEFVSRVVQRYGQNGVFWNQHKSLPQYPVTTWEVWNEPNLAANCPNKSCDGKEYGDFLVATSHVIHEAQAGYAPTVLSGGLYQERWNFPVSSYIAKMREAAGIESAYDGLSLHPYALGKVSENRSYSEKAAGVPSNINQAYNASGKPIWVTEIGWPVAGAEAASVDLQEQAGLLSETYNWIKQNWSAYQVRYAAWFDFQDYSSDPKTKWDQHAGLRDVEGNYRAAWYAYEEETGRELWPLTSRPCVLSFGTDPSSPKQSIFYTGTDGQIWEWYYDGKQWTKGKATSSPAAANTSPSCLNSRNDVDTPKQWVFYTGSDHQLWLWYWDGKTASNSRLLGEAIMANTSPTAVNFGTDPSSPKQSIFYTGADGQIWEWYYDGKQWTNGKATTQAASANTSPIALNSRNDVDTPKQWVFYTGSDHQLWLWYWDGKTASNSRLLGEAIMANTSPTAVNFGTDPSSPKQSIFYTGADGQIWEWYYDGKQWTNGKATSRAAGLNTSPTALNSRNDIEFPKQWVFYAGADRQLSLWYWNGLSASNPSLPGNIPMMPNTSPAAVNFGTSPETPKQSIFYTGADGRIWTWYYDGKQWSNGAP